MGHEREEALGERAQHLLRILIESYIRDGQPVGSRALSRESGLQLSSATVRNVMADLERSEEHTSELQSRVELVCRLLLEKKKSGRRARAATRRRWRRWSSARWPAPT